MFMLKTHCVCGAVETDVPACSYRFSLRYLLCSCDYQHVHAQNAQCCGVETDVPACSCSKRTVSAVRLRLMYQHVHTASTCAVCCAVTTDVPACSCSKRTVSVVRLRLMYQHVHAQNALCRSSVIAWPDSAL